MRSMKAVLKIWYALEMEGMLVQEIKILFQRLYIYESRKKLFFNLKRNLCPLNRVLSNHEWLYLPCFMVSFSDFEN